MNTRHLGLICGVAALVGSLSGLTSFGAVAAERVPELNVKQSCREAQAVSADGDARNSGGRTAQYLQGLHAGRDASARSTRPALVEVQNPTQQNCVAQANPSPSYVEILTCLE